MSKSKNPIVFQAKVSLSASSSNAKQGKWRWRPSSQSSPLVLRNVTMLHWYTGEQRIIRFTKRCWLYAGWKLFVPRPSTVVFLSSSQAPRHPFNDTRGRNSGCSTKWCGQERSHELAVSVRGVGHDGIQPAFIQSVLPSYSPIHVVVVSLQG